MGHSCHQNYFHFQTEIVLFDWIKRLDNQKATPEILFYIFTAFPTNDSCPSMRPLDFTMVEIFNSNNDSNKACSN